MRRRDALKFGLAASGAGALARGAARAADYPVVVAGVREAGESPFDWRDRTRLPRAGKYKVEADEDSDLTLLYVNITSD